MSLVLLVRSAALCLLFFAGAFAHVLVPFSRARNTGSLAARSTDAPLAASGHVFVVNVTVGTPPQPFSLLLSPSSPHTWIPSAEAMPCMTGYDSLSFQSIDGSKSACRWGAFTMAKSSTAQLAENEFVNFVVGYTDSIDVSGRNFTDKFVLGDIEIENFSMGLVSSTSNQQWIGMLGLGNDPRTVYPRASSKYRPNFVDRLVASGEMASQAYSIWLNDPEGSSGSLLLGAIDKSRYEGDLIRLNANQEYPLFPGPFRANLASVSVDNDGKQLFGSTNAILTTISPAETFSYLPDGLAEAIMTSTGATWNQTLQRMTIPCDAGSKKPKLALTFQLEGPNGPVLTVRLDDLVIPDIVSHWEIAFGSLATLPPNTCLFGIQKYPGNRKSNHFNIGSSLLRRTYMVFDDANKEIALAPLAAKPGPADIVPFEKVGARIPSSKFYCTGGESCVETTINPDGTSTTTTVPPAGSTSGESEPNSNLKKIIIGVVVPVVVLAILVPLIYVIIMRRRRQERERAEILARERKESDIDEEDSFREDEFGVKVTVSVSAKVTAAKPPSPPEVFLGVPGALPLIPEERNSGYWADGVLRGTSSGSGSGSERSGLSGGTGGTGASGNRKEVWDSRQ